MSIDKKIIVEKFQFHRKIVLAPSEWPKFEKKDQKRIVFEKTFLTVILLKTFSMGTCKGLQISLNDSEAKI